MNVAALDLWRRYVPKGTARIIAGWETELQLSQATVPHGDPHRSESESTNPTVVVKGHTQSCYTTTFVLPTDIPAGLYSVAIRNVVGGVGAAFFLWPSSVLSFIV